MSNQDIERVLEKAGKFLKDPEKWLDRSNPFFGGKTPRQVIKEGNVELVLDLIDAMGEGVFI